MQWRFLTLFRPPDISALSFLELRDACVRGSEPARRELMARFEPLVWRAVRARLPHASQQDQEEVVANTFIKLLENDAALLARYSPAHGLSPEGYIRRQAVMQASNRYRALTTQRRKVEVPLEIDQEGSPYDIHPDPAPGPEALLQGQENQLSLLQELKAGLTPALAITFELLFVRELEAPEVASALGCSMEVVYTRKKRLLEALEAVIARRMAHSSAQGM